MDQHEAEEEDYPEQPFSLFPNTPPPTQGPRPGGEGNRRRTYREGVGGKVEPPPPVDTRKLDGQPLYGWIEYEAKREVRIAVIELFAGLRTTHVAAKAIKNFYIVLFHAAEKCPFANQVARKNSMKRDPLHGRRPHGRKLC